VHCNIFYCDAPKEMLSNTTEELGFKSVPRTARDQKMAGSAQRAAQPQVKNVLRERDSPKCEERKIKDRVMAEAATTTPPKAKTSRPSATPFEMPKFEIPKFEIPKVEMPAAFREFAERGVAQCKDTYEKMKAAAEEATDVLETTYSTATKGASDYGLKVIEAARVNTNAAFDFAGELITAKTLSEVIELSSAHARKQFEALTEQGKELNALAQKVATDTVEPIKSGMNRAFSKVA
jgi:phasin